jgi:TPR repeat protein
MYLEGECVDKNPENALRWFEKAAEQGLQGSMTTIGLMYKEGNGVQVDPEKAKFWFNKAGFDEF